MPKPTPRPASAERRVRLEAILEAVCAIHLASFVTGPIEDRGGLMVVGPPGMLKSTTIDVLDANYHNAVSVSNLNTTTLLQMQDQLQSGAVRSIVVPDLQALYAGDPRTVGRVEQALMQLAAEGHRGASWQDARFQRFKSRCTIFSAMTGKFFEKHAAAWNDSGFLRRFLWCAYRLEDPETLMNAISQWKRAELGSIIIPQTPANGVIPDQLSSHDRERIRTWVKHQPGPHEIQFALLCRAASVLDWHYARKRIKCKAMTTLAEFSRTLNKDAALVSL
jgi:hypothetical protein